MRHYIEVFLLLIISAVVISLSAMALAFFWAVDRTDEDRKKTAEITAEIKSQCLLLVDEIAAFFTDPDENEDDDDDDDGTPLPFQPTPSAT